MARQCLLSGANAGRRFRKPAELAAGLTAIGVAAMLAGCATVPANTGPKSVAAGGSQVQAYVQPLPPPGPTSSWRPREVVLGFLHASASYAFDPAAARQYLIPSLSKTWKPGPVAIVSSPGEARTLQNPPQLPHPEPQAFVTFKAQHLASLSQTGQYQYSPGNATYEFTLELVNGVWLISELPAALSNSLLLTQSDFEHVYQPRNLFFFATSAKFAEFGELVPDPVYAPLQSSYGALNTNVAEGLVRGLLHDQVGWLSGATRTAFPPGTRLLGVAISGQTAVVNLGGAASHASYTVRTDMVQQLRATLGSEAYSPALARNVLLEINGKVPSYGGPTDLVYEVDAGFQSSPLLYYLNGQGDVSAVGARSPVLSPPEPDVTAVAAAPALSPARGKVAEAVTTDAGCTLVLGPRPSQTIPLPSSGHPCTSLSWDSNGYLWAVAGGRIWMVPAKSKRAEPVSAPAIVPRHRSSGPDILALRMAPDGVRAALLVKTGTADTRLVLAAVSYRGGVASFGEAVDAGPADPRAVAWYTAYELLVVTASGISEVPMTGDAGQQVGNVPAGAESITTNGKTVAVGTSATDGQSQIYASANLGSLLSAQPIAGSLPAYPG